MTKKCTLFFDIEGWWENPYRSDFDIGNSVASILKVLESRNIKGVFCLLGIIAERFPKIPENIVRHGHEIACHGYVHENFFHLTVAETHAVLERAESAIERVVGAKPIGMRCPWLVHHAETYQVLKKRGYVWASNRHFPFPELYKRPDYRFRSKWLNLVRVMGSELLSAGFLRNGIVETPSGILEIPLLSSMDGELLSLMSPDQRTPEAWLDFAKISLRRQYLRSKTHFNLNFHCWIIGTANRLCILEDILDYMLAANGTRFCLPAEMR